MRSSKSSKLVEAQKFVANEQKRFPHFQYENKNLLEMLKKDLISAKNNDFNKRKIIEESNVTEKMQQPQKNITNISTITRTVIFEHEISTKKSENQEKTVLENEKNKSRNYIFANDIQEKFEKTFKNSGIIKESKLA